MASVNGLLCVLVAFPTPHVIISKIDGPPPTVGRALRATMAFKRCGCAPSQRVVNSRKECKVCKNRRERERKQRAHQVEQYVNLPAFNPTGHGHHTRTPDGSSTDTWGRTRAFPAMDCYTPTRGDVHRTFMERHMFKPLGLDGESGPKARRRLSAADDSFSRSNRMFSMQPGELTFVQSCYGKYSLNQVKITREQEDRYLAMQDASRLPLTLRAKFRRFGGEEHYVRVLTPLYANIRNVKAYELVENNTCALLTLFQLVIGRLVQVCDGLTVLSDPFAGSGWLLKGYAQFLERLRNPDDAMHLRGRRFVHNVDGFPRVGEVEFHDILDGDDSVVRLTFGNTPNSFWSDVSVADLGTCTGIEDGCCDDDGAVSEEEKEDDVDVSPLLDSKIALRMCFWSVVLPKYIEALMASDAHAWRFSVENGGGIRLKRGYQRSTDRDGSIRVVCLDAHEGADGDNFDEMREPPEITKSGTAQMFFGVDSIDHDGLNLRGDAIVTSPSFGSADRAILRYYPLRDVDSEPAFAAFLLPSNFLTRRDENARTKLPFRLPFWRTIVKEKRCVVVHKCDETIGGRQRDELSWFIICRSTAMRATLFPNQTRWMENTGRYLGDDVLGTTVERKY